MLAVLAVLIAVSSASGENTASPVCDIGRLALQELSTLDPNKGYARFYGDAHLKSADLLTACPTLRYGLPSGFALADEIATKRAGDHLPQYAGRSTPLTMIFEIGVPVISPDGKSAVVEMGTTCTGLCGSGFIAHYVRGPGGWRRDGKIFNAFVS